MEEMVPGTGFSLLIAYIDYLESSVSYAEKNNLGKVLIKGIRSLHDEMTELQAILEEDLDFKRLKVEVEKRLEDLVDACRSGDEGAAMAKMRQVRDRVLMIKADKAKK